MNFTKKILQNGLTLLMVPIKDAPSVTVLVMVHAGSKYETKEINGLSHFLEHMCFKGTPKRPTALAISRELDSIGSQSNAFTAQEFTGYYAKSHPSHLDQILDVVSDIYLNPLFPEKEIEKEKGVIIEEINMYEDMPDRHVQDVFMEAMYGDQPAGWNIAGTRENVKRMTRQDFVEYRAKHYVAEATVVIVSGNFEETDVEKKVSELFANVPVSTKEGKVSVVENQNSPKVHIEHKETDQTHLVLGVRTFSAKDARRLPLRVLSAVLGNGMSSRLFQKLREEMGVGYYVRSGIDEYTDHGYLAVSTGVDTNRIAEVVPVILAQMKQLAEEPVPADELQKAKDYIVGNMYLSLESSDSVGEFYAIQELLRDEILTPPQIAEKIQKVTAEEVRSVAQEIMIDTGLTMAIVGNVKDKDSITTNFHF